MRTERRPASGCAIVTSQLTDTFRRGGDSVRDSFGETMRPLLLSELGDEIKLDALAVIEHGATPKRFGHNAIIYAQGSPADGFYIVCHGCVLMEWQAPNGFRAALRLASSGQNFGLRSFCAEEPRSTMARSLTATLTLHIASPVIEEAADADPWLFRTLARLVARDAGPQISKIARNGRTPLRIRLAFVLHELTRQLLGRVLERDESFEFPLTQKDLSNLLDVSQETVSRTLHELKHEGLVAIQRGPRRLVIADHAGLIELTRDYITA